MTLKLVSAKIQNFKSLGDVELSFRDLTIIVGSNSSGKSNSLEALNFLKNLLISDSLSIETMQRLLRFGNKNISATIIMAENDQQAEYSISVTLNKTSVSITNEILLINGIEVIKIIHGEGEVRDEDGNNLQIYKSDPESLESLALRSAGNFGNKPFTKKLFSYIKKWKFYDIKPDDIRKYAVFLEQVKLVKTSVILPKTLKIDIIRIGQILLNVSNLVKQI
jgi:predicted ATPase